MNPLAIVGIVALVLGAGVAVEGKLLLDAHKELGTLGIKVAERDAIIKQKESDAKLSEQLLAIQTAIDTKFKTIGNDTRQAITNAPNDDGAAAAARAGVMQFRTPAVPVARHADAGLLQPCERPLGELPATLPYRVLLQLWTTAEQLLATCAESKQRLIEFEKDAPPAEAAPRSPAPRS